MADDTKPIYWADPSMLNADLVRIFNLKIILHDYNDHHFELV